jgi:hypothetical protein
MIAGSKRKYMKTYLMEFYDKDYLENLISLFHREYDGVYFFHFENPNPRKKEHLTEFKEEIIKHFPYL